jgi:hypothetical protein
MILCGKSSHSTTAAALLPHQFAPPGWGVCLCVYGRGGGGGGLLTRRRVTRRHPYLLNVKIIPLQFAKNAVKGKLPLYDWRQVLKDLRILVGEDVVEMGLQRKAAHVNGRRSDRPKVSHFSTAKSRPATIEPINVAGLPEDELAWDKL